MHKLFWCAAGALLLAGGFVGAVRFGARHPVSAAGRRAATAGETACNCCPATAVRAAGPACCGGACPYAGQSGGAGETPPPEPGPVACATAESLPSAAAPAPPAIVVPDEDEQPAAGGVECCAEGDADPIPAESVRCRFMPYCDEEESTPATMPYAEDAEATGELHDEQPVEQCPGCPGSEPVQGDTSARSTERSGSEETTNGCCEEVCPYVPAAGRPAGPDKAGGEKPARKRVKAGYRGDPDARPRTPVDTTEFRPTDALRDEYRWGPF
jgi:hypothetical protein